jgi:hypothetical protein
VDTLGAQMGTSLGMTWPSVQPGPLVMNRDRWRMPSYAIDLDPHQLPGRSLRPRSACNAGTIRTAAAFSSELYRRVVGFPGDCSFGIPASSFPRSGASGISRAFQGQRGEPEALA